MTTILLFALRIALSVFIFFRLVIRILRSFFPKARSEDDDYDSYIGEEKQEPEILLPCGCHIPPDVLDKIASIEWDGTNPEYEKIYQSLKERALL